MFLRNLMDLLTRMADCDHDWVEWGGKTRCRKCGATQ